MMSADDAMALPQPEADLRIPYGPDPQQYGELRLPDGPGPHPVAIIVHGGCWLAEYDLGYISGLAASLTRAGLATWSIEYRRVGDDGGGFPGTFLDVGAATDALVGLASEHHLDLDRVVAVGHSAGGHLALWLAARHRLDPGDELRGSAPLKLVGAIALAGIPDLAAYSAPSGCGAAVPGLLGGDPADVPERVHRTSPIELLPLGVPQVLIAGARDSIVPPEHARRYVDAARRAGDQIELRLIDHAGHFELVTPSDPAWDEVRTIILGLLHT
jgi:acetyl esterase/lipase